MNLREMTKIIFKGLHMLVFIYWYPLTIKFSIGVGEGNRESMITMCKLVIESKPVSSKYHPL